jgi:4-amino-4-deoxy-L-arabinose transferase-like glycosyltransferase
MSTATPSRVNPLAQLQQNEALRSGGLIVAALVLVFVVRLALFNVLKDPEKTTDLNVDGWWSLGVRVAEGEGYVSPNGTPTARRGPVPVLFFAAVYTLVGDSRAPVLASLWLLDVGTAGLTYLIAYQLFKSRAVGLLALLAFALYVPEIRFTTMAHCEPLATFLLAASVYSLLKARSGRRPAVWLAAAGALLGLVILSRSVMLAFPPLLPLVFLAWPEFHASRRKLVTGSAIVLAAVGLVLLPWTVRNYLVFHAFVPASTLGGYNLYADHYRLDQPDYTNNTYSGGKYLGWAYIDPVAQAGLDQQGVDVSTWDEHDYDRFYARRGLEMIQAYPARYLHLTALRFLRLWFNVGFGVPPSPESYLILAVNSALLLLAGLAYFRDDGRWRQSAWLLLLLLLYTTGVHVVFHAQVRYAMPVMPYVILLAAYGGLRWARAIARRPRPLAV